MIELKQGEYLGALSLLIQANGVLVGVTDYSRQDGAGPMHYHVNPHFSFVLRGDMEVTRKKLNGSSTVIETSSYVRAGEWHQNTLKSEKGKNLNLELQPAFFKIYGIDESDIGSVSPLLPARLYKALSMPDDSVTNDVHMLLLASTADWKNVSRNAAPAWLKTIKDLLHDQWNETLSLTDLSAAVNVHPVSISKYFSRYFDMTLGEYRRKLKVEKALEMIRVGRLPLTEIGYACGFYDQSHFIKAFKALTTLLPKDYFRSIG